MPNIAKVLREEIARVSRKEARAAVAPVRKPVSQLKATVSELKKRTAALEQENKRLQGLLGKVEAAVPAPAPSEEPGRVRLTAKGIKSLRRKLKLSQRQLAELVGVTTNSVYLWERKSGGLKLRKETLEAVLSVRSITATEAATRLEQIKKPAKAKKPVARRKKK